MRALIADDTRRARSSLRALLETAGCEIVAEAANAQETLAAVERTQPDVILMDLVMPKVDGIEAVTRILEQQPGARILVLTSFATDDRVFPAIKAGALGYLLKDSRPEDLVRSIHEVCRGESSLHPTIARKVLQELSRPPQKPQTSQVEPLTERELDVLRLVAQGLSNQEIARALVVSEATVRTHVSNILGKLHLASRTQAALYALREGLASLDETAQRQ